AGRTAQPAAPQPARRGLHHLELGARLSFDPYERGRRRLLRRWPEARGQAAERVGPAVNLDSGTPLPFIGGLVVLPIPASRARSERSPRSGGVAGRAWFRGAPATDPPDCEVR